MNDRHAPQGGQASDAGRLLKSIASLEASADTLCERLGSFAKPGAMLPQKDLLHLRESLKRITARVGVFTALAERIAAEPEKAIEPPAQDGSVQKPVATPEDELFPIQGYSDPLTGLPSRLIAEKAIQSAMDEGRPRYAAVWCLDRICHMSGRYGIDVGNQAIRHCARFLTERLPSDSFSFRWRGTSFVVLFDSSGTLSEAKLLMEQIAVQKQKFNFMTNHRSAMVNQTTSFLTIPLADNAAARDVYQKVDRFVETHSGRQPH